MSDVRATDDSFLVTDQAPTLRSARFSEILEPDPDLAEQIATEHFRHFKPAEYGAKPEAPEPIEGVLDFWGQDAPGFSSAADLAVGAGGDVFVSVGVSKCVQRVDSEGRIVGELGRLRSIAPGAWHEQDLIGHWRPRVIDGRVQYENLAPAKSPGQATLEGAPAPIQTPAGLMLEYSAAPAESSAPSAYIEVVDSENDWLNLRHNWTIAVWIRAGKTGGPILWRGSVGARPQYALQQLDSGLQASFLAVDGTTDKAFEIRNMSGLLRENELYHLALVRSGQQFRLLVNGSQVAQSEFLWPTPAERAGPLRIGHAGADRYDGAIGDLRIWSRTLGDAEIEALPGFVGPRERLQAPRGLAADRDGFTYVLDAERRQVLKFDAQHRLERAIQPGSTMFGLFQGDLANWGLWSRNAAETVAGLVFESAVHATDESGTVTETSLPLTVRDCTWAPAASRHGTEALRFNGTSAYGVAKDAAVLQNPPLTVMAWVRPELRDDGDEFPANVVGNSGGGAGGFGFGVNVWQTGSGLTIEHPRGVRVTPGLEFEAERWYHVAICFQADSYRAYVNGYLEEEFTFPEPENISESDEFGLNLVQVGRHSDNFAHQTRGYFRGCIGDWLRIYGRALAADEIAYHAEIRLSAPHGLAIDTEGNLLISDTNQNRIYKLNQNGQLLTSWGRSGVRAGEFRFPTEIVVDKSNRVYVLDQDNKRIQIFDSRGRFLSVWEGRRGDSAAFTTPVDLCIDAAGNIYVADAEQRDILVFDFYQRFLMRLGLAADPEKYGQPLFVDVNRAGHVFVLTNYSRLHKFRPPLRNRVIVDMRATNWLALYRRLRMELDFALRRYDRLKTHHESLLSLARDESAALEEADASRQLLHAALNQKLRLESELETFLEQLSRDEPGLPMPDAAGPVGVEEYLQRLAEQNRWQMSMVIARFKAEARKIDIRRFRIVGGEYLDQHGITLEQLAARLDQHPDARLDTVLILPLPDETYADDVSRFLILRNPQISGRILRPPACRFEERFRTDLTWMGMRVEGLVNSINLMPGESREITFTTKRKRAWETVSASSRITKSNRSLESAASVQRKDSLENRIEDELTRQTGATDTQESSSSSTSTSGGKGGGGFSIGPFRFGGSAEAKRTSHTRSATKTVSSLNQTWNDSKKTLNRVSSEFSEENSLTFQNSEESSRTSRRSESAEDLYSESRKIQIRNINEGRTVNYNFFQIQNVYSSLLSAESVEIHFDTGIEIIRGTGITIGRSVAADELERLQRDLHIYPAEGRRKIVRAIMAQLLRRYVVIPGLEPDDMPRVIQLDPDERRAISLDDADLQRVYRAVAAAGADVNKPTTARDLDRCIPLRKRSAAIAAGAEATHAVNTGNYYVDAQLGAEPATEAYLEERRTIETDRQRALVEEQRARTTRGVFFADVPDATKRLHLDVDQIVRGPDQP